MSNQPYYLDCTFYILQTCEDYLRQQDKIHSYEDFSLAVETHYFEPNHPKPYLTLQPELNENENLIRDYIITGNQLSATDRDGKILPAIVTETQYQNLDPQTQRLYKAIEDPERYSNIQIKAIDMGYLLLEIRLPPYFLPLPITHYLEQLAVITQHDLSRGIVFSINPPNQTPEFLFARLISLSTQAPWIGFYDQNLEQVIIPIINNSSTLQNCFTAKDNPSLCNISPHKRRHRRRTRMG